MTEACVIHELAVAQFEGVDAARFLQGYLTIDTARLTDNFQLTALCDIKGRVAANGWARGSAEHIALIVHRSLKDTVTAYFSKYLPFSRTTLTWPDLVVTGTQDEAQSAVTLEITPDGHAGTDASAWWATAMRSGIAVVQQATSGEFLPQMLGLPELKAVHFDKGCYLGQEVVARAQHRGEVKRRLACHPADAASVAPQPGADVTDAEGRKCGTLLRWQNTGETAVVQVVLRTGSEPPLTIGTRTLA